MCNLQPTVQSVSSANIQPVITVSDLIIKSSTHVLVDSLSFEVNRGETLALVGESGSGKSITSLALLGLLPDSLTVQGDAKLNSHKLPIAQTSDDTSKQRKRREAIFMGLRGARIGMIFQEPMSALNPLHTVAKQLVESLKLAGVIKSQLKKQAIQLLTDVNIKNPESMLSRYPHELSGGQRQRVMIAMAVAQTPDLLIADEPTTALDAALQYDILELLDRLKEQHGMAILLISHDLNLVRQYSSRISVIKQGKVIEQGLSKAIFANPEHRYTKMLMTQDFGQPLAITKNNDKSNKHAHHAIKTQQLTVFYPHKRTLIGSVSEWTKVVDAINIELQKGQALGIVGASGSGKTTIALAITKLLSNHAKVTGDIVVDGQKINSLSKSELRQFRSTIQMVFQDPFNSINPRFNVMQIVEEGLLVRGVSKPKRMQGVFDALQTVKLSQALVHRYPHELSGGQRQRVALARALVLKPQVMVLDEPTSSLDSSAQVVVINLLRDIQAELGMSYILISHDLRIVQALCQQIVEIKSGRISNYDVTPN